VLRFSLYSSALPFSSNGHYATWFFWRRVQPGAGRGHRCRWAGGGRDRAL